MQIQLKENSSVEIVNKDGDTIAKVNEDGSIEGIGGMQTILVDDDTDLDELATNAKVPFVVQYADSFTGIVYELNKEDRTMSIIIFIHEQGLIRKDEVTWEEGDPWANCGEELTNVATRLYRHELDLSNIQGFRQFVDNFGSKLIIISTIAKYRFEIAHNITELFKLLTDNTICFKVKGKPGEYSVPSEIALKLLDDLTEINVYGPEEYEGITLILSQDTQDFLQVTDTVTPL